MVVSLRGREGRGAIPSDTQNVSSLTEVSLLQPFCLLYVRMHTTEAY